MEASQTTRRRSSGNSGKSKNGSIVAEFDQDRETKNAFRFQEDLPKGKDRGDIGTVYVLKSALEKAGIDPDLPIEVTVRQAPDAE